ncbi:hypothetical protein GOBAR_AA10629 [Gossypium barbadense]|uniref:Uncharacterized protein n=1 Tax=Gossypium barbadense TaxID=3634 RepID=A0A2P5Y328_GOSBA|nr:hypothetical protein GOBAR_AA10629 [Gossypium barbadense]
MVGVCGGLWWWRTLRRYWSTEENSRQWCKKKRKGKEGGGYASKGDREEYVQEWVLNSGANDGTMKETMEGWVDERKEERRWRGTVSKVDRSLKAGG